MIALRRTVASVLLRVFEPELKAWFGLLPLGKVFWGYGVLASAVLVSLYGVSVYENRSAVQQVILFVFAGYTIWILVSVWRCAETADPHWGLIARSLTVAWAANAAMMVVFLQLDLVGHSLGR